MESNEIEFFCLICGTTFKKSSYCSTECKNRKSFLVAVLTKEKADGE